METPTATTETPTTTQTQTQTQTEDQRRQLNSHISVDDLKKIRGGIAEGGELGISARTVEKSDEDFARPA